jgi:uncharacterized membrane protein
MSLPTTAAASVEINAPAPVIYGLVADVTNMGRWSPECVSCEWLDEPGRVGSRFRGRNRSGMARWSTVAKVLVADPGREFTFATLNGDALGTRWSYRFVEVGASVLVTESFEAISAPKLIALAERLFIRNRQQQLEAGMGRTLAAIKAAAEASGSTP